MTGQIYSREEIIKEHERINQHSSSKKVCVEKSEEILKVLAQGYWYLLYSFHHAPAVIQDLCCLNGGDEDFVFTCHESPDELPFWMHRLLDNSPGYDVYQLDGCYIYVGYHA